MTHRHAIHRFRSSSLCSAIATAIFLATPALAMAAPQSDRIQEQTRAFDIAAQPLGSALILFGQQAGIQVSTSAQMLKNRQAGAVQGELSLEQALQQLLAGTGLIGRWQGGNLALEPAPSTPKDHAERGPLQFQDVLVVADRERKQGETIIDRRTIEAMPAGNGDITSLLKIHPNVQFDNGQLSSKNPGEIDPANISINGARHWQNLFMLDGLNMNNDIDPGATTNDHDEVPGRSQGLAIDTDLLEAITVYDSNVPASYGGFNGGVVEATTRKPTQELRGKISAQMARSSWTRYHIDKDDPDYDEFEAGFGSGNQPEFSKLITRASLEGHLTENFGLLGSFSRKESTIPTRNFGLSHTSDIATDEQDQKRRIDNYFLKATWRINDDWDMDLSLTHAPEINRGYGSNAIDSEYELKQGGESLSARLRWNAPWARVEQTFNWSSLENSRRSETDYMMLWRSATDKTWSSTAFASQGTHGDIEQQQDSLGYKLVADWNSFSTFGIQHSWQTGLELSKQKVHYERPQPHYSYGVGNLNNRSCNGDPWCAPGQTANNWQGQYASSLSITEGKIGFTTHSWGLFVQDEMRYKRLTVRPGVRMDADDYMDQTTVSPRLAINFDVFGDARTQLSAGANRYYGRNLSTYRLRDGIAAMQTSYTRNAPGAEWNKTRQAPNGAKFSQLDIPYNDELMLGISHIQWDTEFSLKYVDRKGRDLVSRAWGQHIGQPSDDTSLLASNYYTYYNGGESDAQTYSLTVTPLKPWSAWGTQTHAQLILDWTDVVSSGLSDYTSNIGILYVGDPIIQYEGSFMRYSERPADNYNRPWTLRLHTSTHVPNLNLTWSNFLRYREGYTRMAATGKFTDYQGTAVRVWEETDYSAALTWDTRLAWEQPLAQHQAVFVNLDVSNVLDKVIVSNANSNGIPTYEVGRQFMVEVGYRF